MTSSPKLWWADYGTALSELGREKRGRRRSQGWLSSAPGRNVSALCRRDDGWSPDGVLVFDDW